MGGAARIVDRGGGELARSTSTISLCTTSPIARVTNRAAPVEPGVGHEAQRETLVHRAGGGQSIRISLRMEAIDQSPLCLNRARGAGGTGPESVTQCSHVGVALTAPPGSRGGDGDVAARQAL